MAYKSFQTFLILQNLGKKIYIAINTSPCVNISVSVLHDSSFRKNGFVLLLCKFSKNIFLCKILDITFSFCHQKEKVCKRKILVIEVFLLQPLGFTFSFCHQKEKDNKKKDCRLRSGAKKSTYFPKRKELASLKQLFVLNGKYSIFLHAPPLRPEKPSPGGHIASLVNLFLCHPDHTLTTNKKKNIITKTSRLGSLPGRDEEEMDGRCTLIQKAECPQRDDIQVAILDVVLHYECILHCLSIYLSFTNDIKILKLSVATNSF